MKKAWSLLALVAIGSVVFANVDLRTNIQDIYYRGTCEEAGAVTMSVNGNDFYEASTETPVFIRVRLDKGGLLCNTLVDYRGRPDDDPIYLAMRLEGAGTIFGTTINAPAETVSIVRWKGGEPELWLRVQFTSNQWLYNDSWTATNGMAPPNHDARVAWTFGITARSSWDNNNVRFPLTANLPCNTVDVGNTIGAFGSAAQTGWAISTLFCVDVSESILTPMPELNSELNFDTISYLGDVDEEGNDTGFQTTGVMTCSTWTCIRTGDQTTANFSGDDTIARGFDITCSWGLGPKPPLVAAPLCLREIYQGTDQGLICLTNMVEFEIRCDYGLNYNSNIILITPGAGYYGFLVDVDSGGNPISYYGSEELFWVDGVSIMGDDWSTGDWDAVTDIQYIYSEGGFLFTPVVWMIYGGDDVAGPKVEGSVKATVCTWHDNEPSEVVIMMAAAVTNHGIQFDLADNLFFGLWDDGSAFDGITAYDQRKYCPQSYLWLNDIEWGFGYFTDCCSGRVSIFYPYMPKLIGTDWYVGFGIVNQGLVSFSAGEVQARVWEADGNLWTFDLPALPQRSSQTYLMIDGDQGIGLYDDDGNFIAPATTGSDLVMGDVRSSMFVTAFHCGVAWGDIAGPDLDGFALIGNSVTLESFGYLPRNQYDDVYAQTGDMPILTAKKPQYDFVNIKEMKSAALPKVRMR